MLKTVGLFAGIGGFELAVERNGGQALLLADNDSDAKAVLRARFPDADLRSDVADINSLPPETELVAAGFPCQNLSMAGDKTGLFGEKSAAVQHLFRLLKASGKPDLVVENVYFLLSVGRGQAMNQFVDALEKLGYRWAYRVLDTFGFGLPQRRRRLYLYASTERDPTSIFTPHTSGDSGSHERWESHDSTPIGFYWTEGRSGSGMTPNGVPPIKGGSGLGIPSAPAVLFEDGKVLMPDIRSCEQLQGYPSDWTVSAESGSKGARWKLVGNAVTVPVAEWVLKRIDRPQTDYQVIDWPRTKAWPYAAYGQAGERHAVRQSELGDRNKALSIESFRTADWTPLSLRALSGFYSRALEGSLRFPPSFLKGVREQLIELSDAHQDQRKTLDQLISIDRLEEKLQIAQ